MAGPLSGLTIVELAGIGPGPMCSMMLGDMGADVIRVDRTRSHVMDRLADPKFAVHNRSRRSVSVDLQKKEGVDVVLRLIEKADGLTEPFRPGVAERLGLGAGRLPRAQSEAGLRPHDRLGPGGPARQGGRPRHQLHRAHRRAACDRRQGQADAAAQPGRRLRRRRHAARLRHGVRPARGAALGQGPGDRCRDGRRRGAAAGRHLRHGRRRPVERRATAR